VTLRAPHARQRGAQPRVIAGPHAIDVRRWTQDSGCRSEQCALGLSLPGPGPAPSGGLTTNSRRTGEPVLPADAEPVGTSSSSGGQTLQAWSLHSLGPYCDAAAVGECVECDSLRSGARPRRLLTIQPADQDREPHLERRHVDHDASLPRSRHFRKTFSIGVSSFVPETQLRPFLCGPTRHAACVAEVVKSIAPNRHFTRLPHAVGSTAGCTCKGDPFAGRPQRMTHVAFAKLKMAQGEIREALHAIDAIGTRRPAAATSVDAADIDRLIEHLESALTRLRAIRESLGAER